MPVMSRRGRAAGSVGRLMQAFEVESSVWRMAQRLALKVINAVDLTYQILLPLRRGIDPRRSKGSSLSHVAASDNGNLDKLMLVQQLMLVQLDAAPVPIQVSIDHRPEIVVRRAVGPVPSRVEGLKWNFAQT